MSAPSTPADLLDLKMMPAWVNEPARRDDYAEYEGDRGALFEREQHAARPDRRQRPRAAKQRDQRDRGRGSHHRRSQPREEKQHAREARPPLPQVQVRFLPHLAAFESVTHQIKSGLVTYSVFALARLFLDKPERYDVRLVAPAEMPLHQLGEGGAVAADPRILENNAFASAKEDFYTIEVTQIEPLKGNFSNVARCRLSSTLLGPTNHHSYQPQLRSLYEQRFSRRMSFQDYQRQIEIVSDPAVVEQWKEQARSVTSYTTKTQEPPITFKSAAEAERHFRQTHLPILLRSAAEVTISGVLSRRLPDRALGRLIEDAWSAEVRSPSKMMQELAGALRQAGLHIFRHRRGMLFVSPTRIRVFGHERAGVSESINAILEKLTESPGMNRKQLAEKTSPADLAPAEAEKVKLTLASDLRWLISEGYVIEFNDGSLDLPRTKTPTSETNVKDARSNESAAEPAPITAQEHAIVSDEVQQNAGATEPGTSETKDEEVGLAVVEAIQPADPGEE
ncbi:MAG: hypothetical protein ABR589_06445 [Chthoniobacterales bacterium]